MGATAVVSVSWNTKPLTALLLWSLHRILEPTDLSILLVDNASTDGTTELLLDAQDAGLCSVITNRTNLGHGPALDVAMAAEEARRADHVWILDSDCVITRPDALRAPLEWAVDHHEPHFGGIDGARDRHAEIVEQFIDEVGPDLDLVGALCP